MYIVLRFGWSHRIVLPHNKGIAVLELLEHAEALTSTSPYKIVSMNSDSLSVDMLSQQEYAEHKANALLIPDESE